MRLLLSLLRCLLSTVAGRICQHPRHRMRCRVGHQLGRNGGQLVPVAVEFCRCQGYGEFGRLHPSMPEDIVKGCTFSAVKGEASSNQVLAC